jgi:hypothetical protein
MSVYESLIITISFATLIVSVIGLALLFQEKSKPPLELGS